MAAEIIWSGSGFNNVGDKMEVRIVGVPGCVYVEFKDAPDWMGGERWTSLNIKDLREHVFIDALLQLHRQVKALSNEVQELRKEIA